MFAHVSPSKLTPAFPPATETDPCPVLAALTKKMRFLRFLQKEMTSARTEAEKEAVFSVLMKTKVQILALKREWELEKEMEQSGLDEPHPAHGMFPAHRIQ